MMDKSKINEAIQSFDNIIQTTSAQRVEFWYARDIMPLLGYTRWENFENAIEILHNYLQ